MLVKYKPGKATESCMQEKQKVTLYIPPELHRRLKIQAAVASKPMSAIVERAVAVYLENPEALDRLNASYGRTHQVHACPECNSSLVVKDGELASLKSQPTVLAEEELPVKSLKSVDGSTVQPGEEQLVPC